MGTLVNGRTTAPRPVVLVWIDAEAATLVRWDGEPHVERIESDVPARHVSTGHVRHDPSVRHGGGGAVQDRIDRERLDHIRRYLDAVAAAIGPEEDVEILGPAGLRGELAMALAEGDARRALPRIVGTDAAGPMTERQLVARLRARIGDFPRRVHRGPEA